MPGAPLTEETLLEILLDPLQRERLREAVFAGGDPELAGQVEALARRCQGSPELLQRAAQELSGLAKLCEQALAGLRLHPDLPEEARRVLAARDKLGARAKLAAREELGAGRGIPPDRGQSGEIPEPAAGEAASGSVQSAPSDQQGKAGAIQMSWRGFGGLAEWDAGRQVFRGRLAGVPGTVPFEGRSLDELEMAMREAIDLYLEMLSEGD